jgi:hypothetical protein
MTPYVPAGRAMPVIAPRPDAFAAIAAGARARRRRTRNRTVAGAVLALAVAAPLMLAGHDAAGLRPARPLPVPSPTARVSAPPGNGVDAGHGSGGTYATGPATPDPATPAATSTPVVPPCACERPADEGTGESGTLTVTGSDTGYALVSVDRTTVVDLSAARVTQLDEYAGLAIGDTEVFFVRSMDAGLTPSYLGAASVTLRPGTYRVYLLAPTKKPTTLTVPWSGQPSRTVGPDVVVHHDPASTSRYIDETESHGSGVGRYVTLVAATFGPATAGVTLTGCATPPPFRHDDRPPRCRSAHSDDPSVHLMDRVTGEWYGSEYFVRVRGDSVRAAGVLQAFFFSYDRD